MPRLYYARYKAKGLCVVCGTAPAWNGRVKCRKHSIADKKHQKKYRDANLAACKRRTRQWYFRTRTTRIAVRKVYVQRVKIEVIKHYGGACKCCGEEETVFLDLHHINGDGAKHRRELRKAGYAFYQWVKKNRFPKTLELLCKNCNWAKYVLGTCPHERRLSNSTSGAKNPLL